MEQNSESENSVVDLSDVLNGSNNAADSSMYGSGMPEISEQAKEDAKHIPALYRLMIRLSGGIIKNENQAKAVAVVIIIVTNLITFSLVFKNNSGVSNGNSGNVSGEMPSAAVGMP